MSKEICICAAVKATNGKYYRGHRHCDCLHTIAGIPGLERQEYSEETQGFITSRNRFVSREEGYQLQIKAGIKSVAEGGYRHERLYSEDLY